MTMRVLLASALLSCLSGCFLFVPPIESLEGLACDPDDECGAGLVCVNQTCRVAPRRNGNDDATTCPAQTACTTTLDGVDGVAVAGTCSQGICVVDRCGNVDDKPCPEGFGCDPSATGGFGACRSDLAPSCSLGVDPACAVCDQSGACVTCGGGLSLCGAQCCGPDQACTERGCESVCLEGSEYLDCWSPSVTAGVCRSGQCVMIGAVEFPDDPAVLQAPNILGATRSFVSDVGQAYVLAGLVPQSSVVSVTIRQVQGAGDAAGANAQGSWQVSPGGWVDMGSTPGRLELRSAAQDGSSRSGLLRTDEFTFSGVGSAVVEVFQDGSLNATKRLTWGPLCEQGARCNDDQVCVDSICELPSCLNRGEVCDETESCDALGSGRCGVNNYGESCLAGGSERDDDDACFAHLRCLVVATGSRCEELCAPASCALCTERSGADCSCSNEGRCVPP
jgi:hypothetical protein